MTLADVRPDDQAVSVAARILELALANNGDRAHWLDLIERLEECGLIKRKGAAQELLTALEGS